MDLNEHQEELGLPEGDAGATLAAAAAAATPEDGPFVFPAPPWDPDPRWWPPSAWVGP